MKEGSLHWKFFNGKFDFRVFPFQMEAEGKKYFSLWFGWLSTKEWYVLNLGFIRFSFKKEV